MMRMIPWWGALMLFLAGGVAGVLILALIVVAHDERGEK